MFSYFQVQFQKCYYCFSSLSQYEIILKQCKRKHIHLFYNFCVKIFLFIPSLIIIHAIFSEGKNLTEKMVLLREEGETHLAIQETRCPSRGTTSVTAQWQIIAVSVKDTKSEEEINSL